MREDRPPPADVWSKPPPTAPYFSLWAGKADHEYARNALLWFVHEKGLDAEAAEFLERHAAGGDDE